MSQHPEAAEAAAESIAIVDSPERSRFEISVDGTLAGYAEYVDAEPDAAGVVERTFPHTVVEEEYGGRGLATLMIRTALDAARVADLMVNPQCPAVSGFIAKHADYADLVPPARRTELGL
ncbi:GNAT family N-acetyltransferase [Nocardioides sp.]|uniref:GNAT family N-acetyltransferase n=1 Tax=Nocardioides sp. TaxID=35761 RepID=UPI00321935A3